MIQIPLLLQEADDIPCLWSRCDGMRRKRFSLMTHIQDRHCHPQVRKSTESWSWDCQARHLLFVTVFMTQKVSPTVPYYRIDKVPICPRENLLYMQSYLLNGHKC